MSLWIIAFGAIALAFFIYDGILVPSMRLRLRFQLFELRDEARGLKVDDNDGFDDKAFDVLEEFLNVAIGLLPRANISLVAQARQAFANNPELRTAVAERRKIIESCSRREVADIQHRAAQILDWAFLANSGGWTVWVVPIALVLVGFRSIQALFRELILWPETQIHRVLPEPLAA